MAPLLKKYLSDEERLACWRAGSVQKIASMGLTQLDAASILLADPKPESPAEKTAETPVFGLGDILNLPVVTAKTIAAVSLITGIPLGIVAHKLGQRTDQVLSQDRKLETEADYYRDAARQLENGMMASGM